MPRLSVPSVFSLFSGYLMKNVCEVRNQNQVPGTYDTYDMKMLYDSCLLLVLRKFRVFSSKIMGPRSCRRRHRTQDRSSGLAAVRVCVLHITLSVLSTRRHPSHPVRADSFYDTSSVVTKPRHRNGRHYDDTPHT